MVANEPLAVPWLAPIGNKRLEGSMGNKHLNNKSDTCSFTWGVGVREAHRPRPISAFICPGKPNWAVGMNSVFRISEPLVQARGWLISGHAGVGRAPGGECPWCWVPDSSTVGLSASILTSLTHIPFATRKLMAQGTAGSYSHLTGNHSWESLIWLKRRPLTNKVINHSRQ